MMYVAFDLLKLFYIQIIKSQQMSRFIFKREGNVSIFRLILSLPRKYNSQ